MRPRITPNGPFPIQHAFVVQCAAETPLDAMGLTGRVEHLVSGHAIRFQSVQALLAFMAARLREVQRISRRRGAERGTCQTNTTGKEARQEPRSADAVAEERV